MKEEGWKEQDPTLGLIRAQIFAWLSESYSDSELNRHVQFHNVCPSLRIEAPSKHRRTGLPLIFIFQPFLLLLA